MHVPGLESPLGMTARIPSQPARIARAATDFEALLIEQMLKSAHESAQVDSGDSDGADRNSAVVELGEQQFAQSLANSGGLGIAKMVAAGLSNNANR
jgi:Rod binding domain-containing protein